MGGLLLGALFLCLTIACLKIELKPAVDYSASAGTSFFREICMKVYLPLALLLVVRRFRPRPQARGRQFPLGQPHATHSTMQPFNPRPVSRSPRAARMAVAWEQKVLHGKKMDWDVFVDTAPAGQPFSGPVNFSNDPSFAREPFLFQSQQGVTCSIAIRCWARRTLR